MHPFYITPLVVYKTQTYTLGEKKHSHYSFKDQGLELCEDVGFFEKDFFSLNTKYNQKEFLTLVSQLYLHSHHAKAMKHYKFTPQDQPTIFDSPLLIRRDHFTTFQRKPQGELCIGGEHFQSQHNYGLHHLHSQYREIARQKEQAEKRIITVEENQWITAQDKKVRFTSQLHLQAYIQPFMINYKSTVYAFDAATIQMPMRFDGDHATITSAPHLTHSYNHPFVFSSGEICFNGESRFEESGMKIGTSFTLENKNAFRVAKNLELAVANLRQGYANNVNPVSQITNFAPSRNNGKVFDNG